MQSPNLFYTMLITVSFFIIIANILQVSGKRATEAQKYVTLTLFGCAFFIMGFLCHFLDATERGVLFGLKINLMAELSLYMISFNVFQQVYNIDTKSVFMIPITLVYVFLMYMIGVTGTSLAGSGMLFKEFHRAQSSNGVPFLAVTDNWGMYFLIAFKILLLVMLSVFFLKAYIKSAVLGYRINKTFFLIVFIPLLVFIVGDFVIPPQIQFLFLPPFIAIGGTLATALVRVKHFSNIYDLAHSTIGNALNDPLFVVDSNFYVRRVNNAAKNLYPEYNDLDEQGYKKRKAEPTLQNIIIPPAAQGSAEPAILHLANKTFETEVNRIAKRNILYGYIVILHDITNVHNENAMLKESNLTLGQNIRREENRIRSTYEKLISGSLQYAQDKDPHISGHLRRVSNYTLLLAKQIRLMGQYTDILTDSYVEVLAKVASLHDIGKCFLSDEALENIAQTNEEKNLQKSHVTLGSRLIDRMVVNNPDNLYYRLAKEVVLDHHEWWNGNGYPNGLSKEEIPLSARIVAVADTFDKLTDKNLAKARSFDEAFNIIISFSGKQFDPIITAAFMAAKLKLQTLYTQAFQALGSQVEF